MGGTRLGVLAVKHVVSPIQRWVYRASRGRFSITGSAPVLLLTVRGRRTGRLRTVPVFFLADGSSYVLCNVRPPGEHVNPWVLNIQSDPTVTLEVLGQELSGRARSATDAEVRTYWPRLTRVWPAFETFFDAGGERHVFVVEASDPVARSPLG